MTKLRNYLPLVYCAFPGTFITDSRQPQHRPYLLKMLFKVVGSAILVRPSFPGFSPMYPGGILNY